MVEIEFNYNGKIIVIQSNKEEKLKDVFDKFKTKSNIESNSIYFMYSGNILKEDKLTFEEIISEEDRRRNKMNIIVNDVSNSNPEEEEIITKLKEIICPECGESIKMHIEGYNIFLYDCKNGHKKDNILLNEFDNTQKINISKIKCDEINCENNKGNSYENKFYICNKCKKNLCPIHKLKHDKTHNIIEYDEKYYMCDIHNKEFSIYCKECKKDICIYCENEHINHDKISYGTIMPDIDEIKLKRIELEEKINKYKVNINEIKNILNKTVENIDCYYNIINNMINNYDNKKLNYEIIYNLNNIYNNNIIEDINIILNENFLNDKVDKILSIYNSMANNFKLIIKGKEYELMRELNIKNFENIKDEVKISLVGIKNITNMSNMFKYCSSLLS